MFQRRREGEEQKNRVKKTKITKNDIIEVGEYEEEVETTRIKWKHFEVHYLIAIQSEINEEFAKIANKQSKLYFNLTVIFFK